MADDTTRTRQWQGRPALAWTIRIAIFVVPFAAAMMVAFFLSSLLPVASSLPVQIVRWLAIVAVSTVAMMGVDRLARRLLPLSVLLKLTLVFPDHAPSRFGVAMRTGTTAQLRRQLDEAREVPSGETPQEAAERLLQLVGLLSHHDRLTRGHSERVRAYSHLIGEELGLTGSELDKLRWAALLHDVGKTAIDTAILNKPGRLTSDEFDAIKTHPDEGRSLVAPLADWLGDSIQAVWQHHERFDGRGYPQGLSGTDISFAARVVSVADSYDVMTSARSYKKPMSSEAARAELATCSGTQFDPIMVRAFLNVSLGRLKLMTGPLAWFAQLALFEPSGVVHASAASAQSGGTVGVGGSAGGVGSAASTTGVSTAASTATAAAASTGSAGVASTVAATAASVVASTVGIVAASPLSITPVADAAAPVTVAAQIDQADLPAPRDTVLILDSGQFAAADGSDDQVDDGPPIESAAARANVEEPGAETAGSTTTSTAMPAPSEAATPPAATDSTATTSTTLPPTSAPVSPSATTVPSVTTVPPRTTAPSTTSTTTIPPTTSTTTIPPTTSTTTVPAEVSPTLFLGGSVVSDIPAPAFHGVSTGEPLDVALPNFDVDRDDAPGALVQKDAAGTNGTDPTKILKFRAEMLTPFVIDDDLHIDLYVAAKDFARKDINVEVGLYRCTLLDQCTLLGSDTHDVKNAKSWKKTKFHLHGIDTTIGIGEWIEVRVAVLDDSEDDGWFAFGTQQYDSKITVTNDDD